MNHSQVEFEDQIEVTGNDIIIPASFNIPSPQRNAYVCSAGGGDLQSETEASESIEEDDDSRSIGSSSSSNESLSSTSYSEDNLNTNEILLPDIFETARIGNHQFDLPRALCANASIFFDFFSIGTWESLSNENKQELKKYLPKFQNLISSKEAFYEEEKTLRMLFSNQLELFGVSPLQQVQKKLENGNYRPDVIEIQENLSKSKRRENRFHNYERLSQMAKELFISRENILRAAYQSSDNLGINRKNKLRPLSNMHSDTNLYTIRARKRFNQEFFKLSNKYHIDLKELLSEDEVELYSKDINLYENKSQNKPIKDDVISKLNGQNLNNDKKSIFNTYFKRKRGLEDEESLQHYFEKRNATLTDSNLHYFLLEHRRKKLSGSSLAEFETCDVKLRDVYARAQIGGDFKKSFVLDKAPRRKTKTSIELSNEPPALVPIQSLRKYDQKVINNDGFKNVPSDVSDMPSLIKTFPYSPKKNGHFISNSSPLTECSSLREDKEVLHILENEVQFQSDLNYINEEKITEALVLDQTNKLTENVLQTNDPSRKRPNKIDLSNIIDSHKMPRLEPIGLKTKSGTIRTGNFTPKGSHQTYLAKRTSNIPNLNSSSNSYIGNSELMQENHSCFFALVRDFFCATQNHRMRLNELKSKMDIWLRNPITALNEWFMEAENWSPLLNSAVNFLAGEYPQLPEDYVPYIEHKIHLNIYQWIGAGRDSDARLTELCSFWLQLNKKGIIDTINKDEEHLNFSSFQNRAMEIEIAHNDSGATPQLPPPRYPTNWIVRPGTPSEIAEFHRQESERFENPHKAYVYRMHGYESVVGPVKGIYSQILTLTKASRHSVMIADRPNFVTILTLVRDAIARLPNGEGTRADISELLKCSQYINQDAAENVLQSVVSGALDRMHTENDPCVRYDAKKKNLALFTSK